MTSEELKKSYTNLSTPELLEIIDNKFDYTELAVTEAISELSNRQITEEEISSYKNDQLIKAEIFIKKKFIMILQFYRKTYFIFFGFQ